MQKPSVGRIVHFQESGVKHAAIVIDCIEGTDTVSLRVFKRQGGERMVQQATQGPADEQWSWPVKE